MFSLCVCLCDSVLCVCVSDMLVSFGPFCLLDFSFNISFFFSIFLSFYFHLSSLLPLLVHFIFFFSPHLFFLVISFHPPFLSAFFCPFPSISCHISLKHFLLSSLIPSSLLFLLFFHASLLHLSLFLSLFFSLFCLTLHLSFPPPSLSLFMLSLSPSHPFPHYSV